MVSTLVVLLAVTVGQSAEVTYSDTFVGGVDFPARLAPAPGGGVYVTDMPGAQIVEYDAVGAVAALLNAVLLYRGLRRDGVARHGAGWPRLLGQVAFANVAMWVVLAQMQRPVDWWLGTGAIDRVAWLALSIAAGAVAYFAILLVLGMRPANFRLRQG